MNVIFQPPEPINITFNAPHLNIRTDCQIIKDPDVDVYSGPFEITPTEEVQVLRTVETYVSRNIIVNPVPSNYGKITWNGSILLVS